MAARSGSAFVAPSVLMKPFDSVDERMKDSVSCLRRQIRRVVVEDEAMVKRIRTVAVGLACCCVGYEWCPAIGAEFCTLTTVNNILARTDTSSLWPLFHHQRNPSLRLRTACTALGTYVILTSARVLEYALLPITRFCIYSTPEFKLSTPTSTHVCAR